MTLACTDQITFTLPSDTSPTPATGPLWQGTCSPRGDEEGIGPVVVTRQLLQADPPAGRAVVLIGLGCRVQVHGQVGLGLHGQVAL